ncbi:MAG TPA: TlpA disulfide reductase family protein [Acidimicrobiales bacterium]|nr:TlpA disulfide reductase family protein [Acidimicrobiales bacterium]
MELEEVRPESGPTAGSPRAVRWIAGGLAVAVLAFVALLATRQPAATRIADSPLVGRLAPEISGSAVDGRAVRLSGLRGRYVVLNFFATWCVPCQREHPELRDFADAADGKAEVVAVIFDDDPARVREFFERRGGDWPVLDDPGGKVALDYGVRGPPESFLIAPDGVVVSRIVGEVTTEGLTALVARAESNFAST